MYTQFLVNQEVEDISNILAKFFVLRKMLELSKERPTGYMLGNNGWIRRTTKAS